MVSSEAGHCLGEFLIFKLTALCFLKNLPPLHQRCATLISLRLCVQQILHIYFTNNLLASHSLFAIPHNLLAVGIINLLSIMFYPPSFTPLPVFPEGDKLLIGHGWPEWRPKGGMPAYRVFARAGWMNSVGVQRSTTTHDTSLRPQFLKR